jgi:hypothetical protein
MNTIKYGLIAEGILAFCLAIVMYFFAKLSFSMYLLIVPFDLTGEGLRGLSLNSSYGNIIAILLYALLSAIPLIYLLYRRINSRLQKADLLLPIISVYTFYMLYEFINPGLLHNRMPQIIATEDGLPLIKMSIAIIFYSLWFVYLILRLLENLAMSKGNQKVDSHMMNVKKDKQNNLCLKLKKVLLIISVFYTFLLGYFMAFQMFDKFSRCSKQFNITINCTFVVLSYLLNGLPIIFSIITLIAGIKLLEAMVTNHLQEEEIQAATYLGKISKFTVYITVISNISFNVLQFIFSKQLSNTDYTLQISFIPLVIAFAARILSGYFMETKALKEDNEMII